MNLVRFLFMLIGWVVGAWVGVHVVAVFGVFIAAAYPLWFLLFPDATPCLVCRTIPSGARCWACDANRSAVSTKPQSIRSAFINAGLLVLLTILSIGVVFAEVKIMDAAGVISSKKTAYFVVPNKGQYRLGEEFELPIMITGIEDPINAIQADLSFDPSRLEVIDVETDQSFATIFVQKELRNEVGFVRLTGGLPSPGYTGDKGLFGIVRFRTKLPGVARVEFAPSSMILANDRKGTNVIKEFSSTSYFILPESVGVNEVSPTKQPKADFVLGVTDNGGKLTFYEEDQPQVLGESSVIEIKDKLWYEVIIEWIQNIDQAIMDIWRNIWEFIT